MNRLFPALMFTILSTMLLIGCAGTDSEATPGPYEYTHTTELKRFEIYEPERIKDADRSVVVTLEQLGYGDLTLTGDDQAGTPAIEFTLPEGATQGPDTWYLINFHFLIEFADDTGGGFCDVRAKPGASVQFETIRVNDSPYIRVSGQDSSSTSTRIEVRYYNYLSLNDIRPGKNELSFAFREYQGANVMSVTVYSDTAIEVTGTAPSGYDEGLTLSQEEQEKAREIAFSDPWVYKLAAGKEYAVRTTRAYGLIRSTDEPPDNDIELRLVFARNYMIEDVEAAALDIFVDLDEAAVTYLFPLGTSGMPELTASARELVVSIALSDARIQQALTGRPYTVGYLGISMGGPVGRLGANVLFAFDTPYPLERQAPNVPDRKLTGVKAFVNLKEGKVVQVNEESALVN